MPKLPPRTNGKPYLPTQSELKEFHKLRLELHDVLSRVHQLAIRLDSVVTEVERYYEKYRDNSIPF